MKLNLNSQMINAFFPTLHLGHIFDFFIFQPDIVMFTVFKNNNNIYWATSSISWCSIFSVLTYAFPSFSSIMASMYHTKKSSENHAPLYLKVCAYYGIMFSKINIGI